MSTGASPTAISTPPQEVGWEASEQYTSRMNSPKPSPAPTPLGELKKRPSGGNQPSLGSPLRKSSVPHGDISHLKDDYLNSGEDNVIHIDGRRYSRGTKITGGGEKDNKLDLGPNAGNTPAKGGFFNEQGEGTPILASDEMEKRPNSAWLHPAVSPEAERPDWLGDANYTRRGSGAADSRPSSRPNSIHGGPLSRFMSHEERPGSGMGTPLEEIEEYEPLFPEDDDKKSVPTKKFPSRPGLAQHHFPSQDVWEDTPDSLQFTTSVETPEPSHDAATSNESAPPSAVFETPEQEQMRRQQGGGMLSDRKTFVKPHFKSGVQSDLDRPGVQRFPSHDIWEDTPDSMRLETTVSGPQEPEIMSPDDERPTTTALPRSQDDGNARATTGMTQLMRPHIPSRPVRSSKLSQDITPEIAPVDTKDSQDPRAKEVPDLGALTEASPTKTRAPSIPDRPKPSIPARPSRSPKPEDSRAISPEQAPAPKAKPAVPARPANSKFANLKSGFMNDLASRIQLGPTGPPPKPKEPEPEIEEPKAPLVDARKSRAKGPARRKPAASPSGATAAPPTAKPLTFSFSTPITVWHIDASDVLHVPSPDAETTHPKDSSLAEAEKLLAANTTSNVTEAAPAPERQTAEAEPATQVSALAAEPEPEPSPLNSTTNMGRFGAEGDEPIESISPPVQQEAQEIHSTLEAALSSAEPVPRSAEETQSKLQAVDANETAALNVKPTEIGDVTEYTGNKDPATEGNVVLREGEEVGRQ
jgi:hypothetical protein